MILNPSGALVIRSNLDISHPILSDKRLKKLKLTTTIHDKINELLLLKNMSNLLQQVFQSISKKLDFCILYLVNFELSIFHDVLCLV